MADLLGLETGQAVQKDAVISECTRYRYKLTRRWDGTKPMLPVCMLNPSTADHEKDDPTIRELTYFATQWGYGGLSIINLLAFRSSSPKEMMASSDPFGPENGTFIQRALTDARHSNAPLLAAWGNGGTWADSDEWFRERAAFNMVSLICLGLTKDGHPKHPMARGVHRIPRDQQPIAYGRRGGQ
ncbi:DUF1643 domain-containing protein [Rhizobium tumorigenes]|uniref:DUF1643 domain-containing protein n=1 Tax=Rhizobium tumorigenes TaxID=2041385 RepID=UPI00241C55BD|nr:DUF1643 domain-containing protein [Rhizobium tumorigenes]WFS01617.1 DUF1643 domain-containing protein [Rhizobium tumorigenes]